MEERPIENDDAAIVALSLVVVPLSGLRTSTMGK